jgi:hyaluronan synthase
MYQPAYRHGEVPGQPGSREIEDESFSRRYDADFRDYGDNYSSDYAEYPLAVEAREEPRGSLSHSYDIPEVTVNLARPVLWVLLADIVIVAAVRHGDFIAVYRQDRLLMIIWATAFLLSAVQWVMSWRERPYTVTPREAARLGRMHVVVNIPVYNEDPALLDRALFAIFIQTRLPDHVEIVDDGSAVGYDEVREYWDRNHPPQCQFTWIRQENQGKKEAQARTFARVTADILVTLDSDTALERRAIEEGLKPFANRRVQSVAGLELAYNHHKNWLTRMSGTRSLVWQLLSCSAQSVLGDVLVNRGTYALYRAPVVQDNIDAYLNETFFGHPVHLGDDAALTLFARGRGLAVQQPTAVQLTMYPETLSHHVRQWTRWMRGSTIRTFWRLRYLKVWSWSWWFTAINLWMFLASTAVLLGAAVLWPLSRAYLVTMLIASGAWSYGMALRLFSVVRSDESWWGRFHSFLINPFVTAWILVVLRPLRIYGICTCMQQGWVTRLKKVEVGIDPPDAGPDPMAGIPVTNTYVRSAGDPV